MEVAFVELILVSALLLQIIFQVFYLIGFSKLRRPNDSIEDEPPISVVISARNESENLLKNLPSLLSQDYGNFEIILINDRSTDNTLQVMKAFAEKDRRVKIVDINNERYDENMTAGKKFALTMGIKSANSDFIAFTDADCEVLPGWLKHLVEGFVQGGAVLIGTGNYSAANLIAKLHSTMNLRFAHQGFALSSIGIPVTAVGRSMAINREAFFRVQGFKNHMSIKSGSDDLLLQSLIGKAKVLSVPDAITISNSPKNLGSWFRQRTRHMKASVRYKWWHQLLFLVYEFSFVGMLISLLYALLQLGFVAQIIVALFLFRLTFSAIGLVIAKRRLNHPLSSVELIVLEIPAGILNSLFSSIGLLTKPTEWTREE